MLDEDVARAVALRALPLLDLTNLSDDCDEEDVRALCARAVTAHGDVAAVCVWPRFAAIARECLDGTPVKVAAVANFPDGNEDSDAAAREARLAADAGAEEIDVVQPYRAFLDGRQDAVQDLIGCVREALPRSVRLKVILETGALGDPMLVRIASLRAIQAGADFLKTSTGRAQINARPASARIMLEAIAETGKPVGFKSAGGVRTVADADTYLTIADEVMGPGWASPRTFRFGASALLDALLFAIDGDGAAPARGY